MPCGLVSHPRRRTFVGNGSGVSRGGALERVQLLLEDWQHAHRRLTDTETRMTAVLDELQLTELVT